MKLKKMTKGHQATLDFKRMGAIIKEARKNAGLTQEQLSEMIDVTPAFVGHIERGERSVSLKTLFAVADELNISFDYLLSENVVLDETQQIVKSFEQLIEGKSVEAQQAVLDLVRTALKYME